MNIDYSPRQSGKTTRLLERMEKDDTIIFLAFCYLRAAELRHSHPGLAERIYSWREWLEKIKSQRLGKYALVVDDADLVLYDMLGRNPIDTITLSIPEKNMVS